MDVRLELLDSQDEEQFIKDNQAAFNYGAEQYFNEQELKEQHEEEGQISGNITDMIYKGKYYQVKIWLDNDTALIVDTPYDWDTDDRVGLVIKKEDIKVRHDEKD